MSANADFLKSQTSSAEGGATANGSALSLQTLGATLRDRRENYGLMLADVEKTTRIRQKYLAAIEADEWHLLPGEVVGRGFLRNYSHFLNLDANQMIERRRAMVDNSLVRTLANTSAETQLPPVRSVDYRPKDVALEHTTLFTRISEYTETGQDWLVPILAAGLIVLAIFVVGWSVRQMSAQVVGVFGGLQERASALIQENWPNQQADDQNVSSDMGDSPDGPSSGTQEAGQADAVLLSRPTDTPTAILLPTDTPIPLPTATETPIPVPPTATYTPIPLVPLPTATPVPIVPEDPPTPQPQIVPVVCEDSRLAISSPGVNQTVSGDVLVMGRAVHEKFKFYKLEWAPGANAESGFAYFDGTEAPVENGLLGRFPSTGMANNGLYTLRLTVVDITSNFPTPCRVTINVQN